jgi:hypothetical protein
VDSIDYDRSLIEQFRPLPGQISPLPNLLIARRSISLRPSDWRGSLLNYEKSPPVKKSSGEWRLSNGIYAHVSGTAKGFSRAGGKAISHNGFAAWFHKRKSKRKDINHGTHALVTIYFDSSCCNTPSSLGDYRPPPSNITPPFRRLCRNHGNFIHYSGGALTGKYTSFLGLRGDAAGSGAGVESAVYDSELQSNQGAQHDQILEGVLEEA